ncbi:MAG: TIGR02300 family protein [Pseudomonadota bacterium]
MAKANLGTKRVCPETGRKFYDLEKDPIVSPYTGKEYPISFFEGEAEITAPKPEKEEKPDETKTDSAETQEETDIELDDAPEIISLEDAEDDVDDDDDDSDEEIPDIPDIPDVDIDDEDDAEEDDTFLEDDDEDDDLSDVIVGVEGGDDEV